MTTDALILTLSALAPATRIYAAEPEQADDAARSFRAGRASSGNMMGMPSRIG